MDASLFATALAGLLLLLEVLAQLRARRRNKVRNWLSEHPSKRPGPKSTRLLLDRQLMTDGPESTGGMVEL
jgi:hypothetical protein